MRSVLFFRDFRQFHGGHLKVWDYFNHVRAAAGFEPRIAFSGRSDRGPENPWSRVSELVVENPADVHPDAFFLAGPDWRSMDRHPDAAAGLPVINLLQHIRHADPASNRYGFLRRPAIRICVSEAVAEAVRATGIARGPVIAIPNAIDLAALPAANVPREVEILISALKRPELGRDLAGRLGARGRRVELISEPLPRDRYLDRVRRATVTVFLPNESEGFFLPPLEGMALGTLVVCPEFEGDPMIYGNRKNCIRCARSAAAIAAAAEEALELPAAEAEALRAEAARTVAAHRLERERAEFHRILDSLDDLWPVE